MRNAWKATAAAVSATAAFGLTAALTASAAPAANVRPCTVLEKGFSALPSKGTPGAFDVSAGYVVRANANVAGSSDVVVNFLDADKRIIKSLVGESIPALPKGQKIPYGLGETDEGVKTIPREPASIQVLVTCDISTQKTARVPVGRVPGTLDTEAYVPTVKFQAPVVNTSGKTWRYGTEVGFVVRGGDGAIVGGGVGQTYADLPSGGTIAQDVSAEVMPTGREPYSVQFAVFPLT